MSFFSSSRIDDISHRPPNEALFFHLVVCWTTSELWNFSVFGCFGLEFLKKVDKRGRDIMWEH